MNIKSIILILIAGLLFTTGCTSTYTVSEDNIHEIPISGTVSEENEYLYTYRLFFKSEGMLSKISSVQWGKEVLPLRMSEDNKDLMMTDLVIGKERKSDHLVKIIVTPDHSPFVRFRSVEIPIELIHDTFINNTNYTSFLKGEPSVIFCSEFTSIQ